MSSRITSLLMLLTICLAVTGYGFAQAADPVAQKIDPKVLSDLGANGQTTFFVVLKEQADTSPAIGISDWKARGEYVVNTLKAVARQTQPPLLETIPKNGGRDVAAYWIFNCIQVTANNTALIEDIAARPYVSAIVADQPAEIPEPSIDPEEPAIQSVAWNITQVHADAVWEQFNIRGEGIVVANIDTGVQFDHPALLMKYRGRGDNGSVDHNYNWFNPNNPTTSCRDTSVPCDTVGHGTHTMGTMVGDDDAGNQVGVAPGAKWIAAQGCMSQGCPTSSLLRSGEWMLAPTDLNGQNPLPELRPHVINNSWGGGGSTFYQATVQNWRNAGIFPVFASGNPGSSCGRVSTPAAYPESFAVGGTAQSENIYSASGRGPARSFGNIIKPNVTAPAVGVRSSTRSSRYVLMTGTSMATPHVAGVLALLWSANRDLIGDVDSTFDVLQSSARFRSSTQCGEAGPPNNVFGWGIVDALAAVQQVTVTGDFLIE